MPHMIIFNYKRLNKCEGKCNCLYNHSTKHLD